MNGQEVVDRIRGFFTSNRDELEREARRAELDAERAAVEERCRVLEAAYRIYETPELTAFLAQVAASLEKMQRELVAADDLTQMTRIQGKCRALSEICDYPHILRTQIADARQALHDFQMTDAG